MAKIVKSDAAPDGPIQVVFGVQVVDLDTGAAFHTDNLDVVEASSRHAWLEVVDDNVESVSVPDTTADDADFDPDFDGEDD